MTHLLKPVGLGPVESDVYLHLLSHAHAAVPGIAGALGLTAPRVRTALSRLTSAGLANRLIGRPARYVAAPPEVALDSLVLHHHQVLDELRAQARELSLRAKVAAGTQPGDLIEVLDGADAVLRTLTRLELGARHEVCIIDAPPYLSPGTLNTNELQALARGVAYRGIYHAPTLAAPGTLRLLDRYLAEGEQARTLPDIRMKMLIADGELAVVPISFTGDDAATRLLVRPSPVLDALKLAFEALWNRATPVGRASAEDAPSGGGHPLSPRDLAILRLLASGAKDRSIARALDVTERTVERRVAEIVRMLDASTRFQAGVQAAARGWL
ncbi:helix-turn-helix domain-containing protein [Streptomyces sp. NRRL F-5126]|uniref:helix-turn-helix domain-containing protein n=1 Tax=Streptomyces sp. NRRL F-5126 TaxID=1463857 RepID=UPI0004CC4291|nr:helix-turn-helix domain-containing protein [Streptomyces sp. NRRL F-5126]